MARACTSTLTGRCRRRSATPGRPGRRSERPGRRSERPDRSGSGTSCSAIRSRRPFAGSWELGRTDSERPHHLNRDSRGAPRRGAGAERSAVGRAAGRGRGAGEAPGCRCSERRGHETATRHPSAVGSPPVSGGHTAGRAALPAHESLTVGTDRGSRGTAGDGAPGLAAPGGRRRTLRLVEGAQQVADEVVGVLDSDREPDERHRHLQRGRGHGRVRHHGRHLDERLHAAE